MVLAVISYLGHATPFYDADDDDDDDNLLNCLLIYVRINSNIDLLLLLPPPALLQHYFCSTIYYYCTIRKFLSLEIYSSIARFPCLHGSLVRPPGTAVPDGLMFYP